MKHILIVGFTFSMIFACTPPMQDIENELLLSQSAFTEPIENQ